MVHDGQYLQDLAAHQLEPGLLIERERLASVMREWGAKGISVPDPLEPFQIRLPLYIGATTPSAKSEVPHWHMEQAEAYLVLEGQAEFQAKWRWDNDGWVRRVVRAGDLIVAQPEVCHLFTWRSGENEKALALVFKAPQIPGVGRPPKGKTTCTNGCPHYQRGCVLPEGVTPTDATKT